jgi:predicted esterase
MEYIMLLQYVVIHKAILSSAGINDPIVSRTETENLYRLFRKTNANVILKCNQCSHNAIQEDVLIARRWISNNFSVYV